jgi:hypothetical protein
LKFPFYLGNGEDLHPSVVGDELIEEQGTIGFGVWEKEGE